MASFDSSSDPSTFAGHRDTFTLLGLQSLHNGAVQLPHAFWKILVSFIDGQTYRAIRLACRNWSQAVTGARPMKTSIANWLPPEVHEKIYRHLKPTDFNAARHTCRAWIVASLEERLLIDMLQNCGWWGAARLDVDILERQEGRKTSIISEDWLLSKRLVTEYKLSPSALEVVRTRTSADINAAAGPGVSARSTCLSPETVSCMFNFYILQKVVQHTSMEAASCR